MAHRGTQHHPIKEKEMISQRSASATSKISFEVADEEPVHLFDGYSNRGKKISPFAVTVIWVLKDRVWIMNRVDVTGCPLKKDGTPGMVHVTREAFRARYDFKNKKNVPEWAPDTPQWLRDAVEAADPSIGSE
jgi:hypothetical protein